MTLTQIYSLANWQLATEHGPFVNDLPLLEMTVFAQLSYIKDIKGYTIHGAQNLGIVPGCPRLPRASIQGAPWERPAF